MRRPLELGLRIIGIGALLIALMLSLRTRMDSPAVVTAPVSSAALGDSTGETLVSELSSRFVRAARDSMWPSVSQSFARIPSRVLREVLATPVAAGMPLRWVDSTGAVGLAVAASPALDPQGGTVVRATGARLRPLLVRDDGGPLDSMPDGRDGITVRGARVSGHVEALQGASRAVARVPTRPTLKRVLLVARPGWEAKFTAAALEERGWHVDGSLLIARNASVSIGEPSTLDTVRYGTAIVLDSGLVSRAALERFVSQGGGVIVANDALQDATLRPLLHALLPATLGESQPGVPGALLTASPRLGLDAWTLRAEAGGVVLLEDARGTTRRPAVIAERRGVGRVLVSAYRDTWRWRMEGNDDGIDAHRAFWSGLVSAATLAPRSAPAADQVTSVYPGDAAPFADLVARLGFPVVGATRDARALPPPVAPRLWLLYVVASIALLGEWTLRRVRGAP
jgi:hypothetical protein